MTVQRPTLSQLRDITVELAVARAIHLAHAAGTEGANDFVRTDGCAWNETH